MTTGLTTTAVVAATLSQPELVHQVEFDEPTLTELDRITREMSDIMKTVNALQEDLIRLFDLRYIESLEDDFRDDEGEVAK